MIRCTLSLLSLYLSPLKLNRTELYIICIFMFLPLLLLILFLTSHQKKECFVYNADDGSCCCRMLFLNGGKIVVPFLAFHQSIRIAAIQNNIILILCYVFLVSLLFFLSLFSLFLFQHKLYEHISLSLHKHKNRNNKNYFFYFKKNFLIIHGKEILFCRIPQNSSFFLSIFI